MRKDVRLGFSVGALLLAVIIVAVLVIHRGKNNDKTVALDSGKGAASSNDPSGPIDVGGRPVADSQGSAPASVQGNHEDGAGSGDSGASSLADAGGKAGSQWDQLFQSTAADPIQAELSSPSARARIERTADSTSGRRSDSPARPTADGASDIHSTSQYVDPPLPGPQPTPDSPRTHKLQAGETFMSISKSVYGSSRYFKAIVAANPTLSPERLKPGTLIQLPPASQVKQSARASHPAAATPSAPPPPANSKTYTVQKDDSLYKIARKLYGKGERSGELYTLNRSVIGPDSTRLKIGMVLTLPESSIVESHR